MDFLSEIDNTTKKISELSGYSQSTVQRALSNVGRVAPVTRQRIMDIAEELGYRPNKAARLLVLKKQKIQYGVIFNNSDNVFYGELLKGIKKAQEEVNDYGIGIDVHFTDPTTGKAQAELIDQMVKEKKRGIVLLPIDCDEVRAAVNRGVKQNVEFVSMASDITRSRRLCFVGPDQEKCGEVAAGLLNLFLGKEEKVVCFVGFLSLSAIKKRVNGFRRKFEEIHPVEKWIGVFENSDSNTIAEEQTTQVLSDNPDVKAIFIGGGGVNGVCRAIEKKGLVGKIRIVAVDKIQSQEYCEKGVIDFVLDQDPVSEGYQAIDVLNKYILFDELPDDKHVTKIHILTKENINL
jgi:LacI family transcriptional regulator, galactose operon repressor